MARRRKSSSANSSANARQQRSTSTTWRSHGARTSTASQSFRSCRRIYVHVFTRRRGCGTRRLVQQWRRQSLSWTLSAAQTAPPAAPAAPPMALPIAQYTSMPLPTAVSEQDEGGRTVGGVAIEAAVVSISRKSRKRGSVASALATRRNGRVDVQALRGKQGRRRQNMQRAAPV